MGFIKLDGKFNENWYLIDAQMFGMKKNATIYIIENKGSRLMIDTTTPALMMRKIIKKIKRLGLYPIQKLLLTHSHWDHIEGVQKLKSYMSGNEIEIFASELAIDNLENPFSMNQEYGVNIEAIDNVIPLKDGDIIDLNGLELEILNLFGHSNDLIGILDRKNRLIFTGDAVLNKYEPETLLPVFLSHEFNETQLINTFKKLKRMNYEIELNTICLSHFGAWNDDDFDKIIKEMEVVHHKTKQAIKIWYNENPSIDYITSKYHETFIPYSKIFPEDKMMSLKLSIEWLVEGLKFSGFI
jgi:glyoxylase-like metal-dependent hydrolase (beta-lactamase superfamily II)